MVSSLGIGRGRNVLWLYGFFSGHRERTSTTDSNLFLETQSPNYNDKESKTLIRISLQNVDELESRYSFSI